LKTRKGVVITINQREGYGVIEDEKPTGDSIQLARNDKRYSPWGVCGIRNHPLAKGADSGEYPANACRLALPDFILDDLGSCNMVLAEHQGPNESLGPIEV